MGAHCPTLASAWPTGGRRFFTAHRKNDLPEAVCMVRKQKADHRGEDHHEAAAQDGYQPNDDDEADCNERDSEHDMNLSFFRSRADHPLTTPLQASSRMSQARRARHVRCRQDEPGAIQERTIDEGLERRFENPRSPLTVATIGAHYADEILSILPGEADLILQHLHDALANFLEEAPDPKKE